MSAATPFAGLDPEAVLAAVATLGFEPDGRLLALNSYENRVYRVGVEPDARLEPQPLVAGNLIVAKFYRDARWSDAQIREEHHFARQLAAAELPVAAPLECDGDTLLWHAGFRFALFPCWRGAAPELDDRGNRELLGRTLGRLHAVGATSRFAQRPSITAWQCGERARRQLLASGRVPASVEDKYAEVSATLVESVRLHWEAAGPLRSLRLHGDCHLGNVLWNAHGPVFVDLDDCLTGPAVQDLWMLCAGSPGQREQEWAQLLTGYRQFADFDATELRVVEALRAMRMLNHAAWVAQRWADPAFPRAFPWFGQIRYWENHVTELHEQLEALEAPPLGLC
ncbi:MAG: serine/threonine protein kinase [Nevskiaceae bacterium]|nr:serine/threonine protein kinase [Nevskiaceae bacterium]